MEDAKTWAQRLTEAENDLTILKKCANLLRLKIYLKHNSDKQNYRSLFKAESAYGS